MEIRHRDIFPWNQLNIHILVVYSKTIHNWRKTLKSWRITPGGLTSSAKTNMCPIPSIWKPPFSFNFASFFLYVLAQQVKRTSTACHLFFLLQDCLCAVKRRHHWVIVAELVMSAVLLSYLDNMKILSPRLIWKYYLEVSVERMNFDLLMTRTPVYIFLGFFLQVD